jgi:hypothetical protein
VTSPAAGPILDPEPTRDVGATEGIAGGETNITTGQIVRVSFDVQRAIGDRNLNLAAPANSVGDRPVIGFLLELFLYADLYGLEVRVRFSPGATTSYFQQTTITVAGDTPSFELLRIPCQYCQVILINVGTATISASYSVQVRSR